MAKVGLEQVRKVYPEGNHVAVAGATFGSTRSATASAIASTVRPR